MSEKQKGVIAWFTHNTVAANLLMAVIIIGGIVSALLIRKEVFPQLDLPYISIQVPYPGAAPQEVEEGIVLKVEEAIENIEGIKEVKSTASEGNASIQVEVEPSYNTTEVLNEIKIRVDAIPTMPEQAEKPVIYEIRPEQEVIWVQVYGDLTERGFKEYAKSIADDLKDLPGITRADVQGSRNYEVGIEVSEDKLRKYGLTLDEVARAVRNSSVDMPGGSIKSATGDILLRAKGKAYRGYQFDKITLLTRNDGTRVLVNDVAKVIDGFVEQDSFARFNGKPGVSIGVVAVGDQDALKIAEAVKKYVADKKKNLPAGVQLDYWGDSSKFLSDRLDMMLSNMVMGGILVFLVLSLFLQVRLAFWVMMGIPVCFLGTLLMMHLPMFDITINMMSLFGFILVLGIVVDDAIVIGESVHSEIEERGAGVDNVIRGAQKVAVPATFGVLTTVAAFAPMLMVTGFMGAIFEAIGVVVILCLVFSLIESKFILPAHLKHVRISHGESKNPLVRLKARFNRGFDNMVLNYYRPALNWCLRYRYITVSVFIAMMILVAGLVASGNVRFVFFPNIPSDFVQGRLEMVSGTASTQTNQTLEKLQEALWRVDDRLKRETGNRVVKHVYVWNQSTTEGRFVVELTSSESRSIGTFKLADMWRQEIGQLPGVKTLKINASINGDSGGGAIAFTIRGKNLDELKAATGELKAAMAKYDGVFDIEDSLSSGNLEVRLKIKPAAQALGLSLTDLARQVREGFYGAEVQRIQRDDEEVKVMVRYPLAERESLANLENMRIRTSDGSEVPFSYVADVELGDGYSRISRVDGVRAVTVSADADKNKVEPSKVIGELMKDVVPGLKAKYPGISLRMSGEAQDEADNNTQLLLGALLALFVIYALLAIPLNSYLQPFIIMSVIPFGIIGAIVGHWLLGLSVSVLSLFGIIALSGVVVNDSLVMVDFVNQARKEGVAIRQAVVDSGIKRFRAIMLTSLTTFLGLVPIVTETSLQAQIIIPMAVSLAFGILFATVITLVLVPALYLILEDFKKWVSGHLHWTFGSAKADAEHGG
ncbi:efflux RND transporter permease subunit [Gallaecimonas pentaromativorans]|uniref:Multidrug efflux pump subunit AcrB n=1 Tax=Gallaecimonas pentaromativorans TaxID=584787 RepID=A0A3N1PTH0_9GAMM|nr:efflux RND transporter permease subunit [Gallaecimonas pentaromativorans]ROQ30030.1 multidrug efflux pump subunit AcrB [Gallaecimonas pentaromativorans]